MLYRLFSTGKLSSLAKTNIGAAAQFFRSLSDEQKISHAPEFGDYTYSLIQHVNTNRFVISTQLEELIDFNVNAELPPIKLPPNSRAVLDTYFQQALEARDMKALNASLHLYWHNFKASNLPFKDVRCI